MRQIKFRAWYKGDPYPLDENDLELYEKPRMIYDVHETYDGSGMIDHAVGTGHMCSFSSFIDDEDYIVEQFVGFHDKHGIEIYENDVVTDGMQTFVVEIGEHIIEGDYGEEILYYGCNVLLGGGYPGIIKNEYEVIGNTHTHPEYLQGKDSD